MKPKDKVKIGLGILVIWTYAYIAKQISNGTLFNSNDTSSRNIVYGNSVSDTVAKAYNFNDTLVDKAENVRNNLEKFVEKYKNDSNLYVQSAVNKAKFLISPEGIIGHHLFEGDTIGYLSALNNIENSYSDFDNLIKQDTNLNDGLAKIVQNYRLFE